MYKTLVGCWLNERYEITAFLEKGGMGAVFDAHDHYLQRRVAVKVVRPDHVLWRELRTAFEQEIYTIASLRHPHILAVHDRNIERARNQPALDDDLLYLVMDFLDGGSLKQRLASRTLALDEVERIFGQICQAVAYAHRKQVIHLDLKPGNILFDEHGNALVADFGLAKPIKTTTRVKSDPSRGTPGYMPPEQEDGDDVGPYSDIYALGIMLYEMLTGVVPKRGWSKGLDRRVLVRLDLPLPGALKTVIERAVLPEPDQRYQTVSDLAWAVIAAVHPEQAGVNPAELAAAKQRLHDELAMLESHLQEKQQQAAQWSGSLPPYLRLDIEDARAEITIARSRADAAETPAARNPYRGLQRFNLADAHQFFGREALVATLVERLRTSRFLAVLGPSGSGKSSLVRAGLLPALRTGVLPGSTSWHARVLTPRDSPLTVLAELLTRVAGRDGAALLGLVNDLRTDLHVLWAETRLLFADAPDDQRLLLVFDQFEEVFTLCRDAAERVAFLAALLDATEDASGRLMVVLTMRADFYGQVASEPAFAARLPAHHVLVGPLQPEELRRAIGEPARAEGVLYAPGVVDTIIEDVTDQPGALPLLQHALLETWDQHQGDVITLADYQATGGVEQALAKRAQVEYDTLDSSARQAADWLLRRLVRPGEGAEDTRRRATLSEVMSSTHGDAVYTVIDTFTNARLLTMGNEGLALDDLRSANSTLALLATNSSPSVELSHEALIRAWPHLRDLIASDREGLRVQQRLTETASEWSSHNQDASYLYRGGPLAITQEWATTHPDRLNTQERTFLDASVAAIESEKRRERHYVRTLQRMVIGLGILLVAALGLGEFAYNRSTVAAHQAQVARTQAITAQAVAQIQVDPERSLLLAIEAVSSTLRLGEPELFYQTQDALHLALLNSLVRNTFYSDGRGFTRATYSPDGQSIVATNGALYRREGGWGMTLAPSGPTAQIWDIQTEQVRLTLQGHTSEIWSALYSPDGQYIVTASGDHTAKVWDAQTGLVKMTLTGHADSVFDASYSPDGKHIVTASADNTAKIWDSQTGQLQRTLQGSTKGARIWSAAYSPDGATIVTASSDSTAQVWDVQKAQKRFVLQAHTGEVWSASYSPDGKHIVTASTDGSAKIWSSETGELQTSLNGHVDEVNNAVYSPDSRNIITAGADSTVRIWDTSTGQVISTLRGHNGSVLSAFYSPDGRSILTASQDGTLKIWQSQMGEEIPILYSHTAEITNVSYSVRVQS